MCGSCATNFIPYPPGTYAIPPGAPSEPAGTLLRTCDDCIREPTSSDRASYSSFPAAPRPPLFAKRPRSRSVAAPSASAHASTSSSSSPRPSSSANPSLASSSLPQPRFSSFRFYRSSSPSAAASSHSEAASKHSTVESTVPLSASSAAVSPATSGHHRGFRLLRRENTAEAFSDDDDDEDDDDRCPICGYRLSKFKAEDERESHVNSCLTGATFSGSPDQARRRNRMVVYRLPESQLGKECVICFEEFEKDDLVARLECLCVYHRKCIRAWFEKKGAGECPIHAVHA